MACPAFLVSTTTSPLGVTRTVVLPPAPTTMKSSGLTCLITSGAGAGGAAAGGCAWAKLAIAANSVVASKARGRVMVMSVSLGLRHALAERRSCLGFVAVDADDGFAPFRGAGAIHA